MTACKLYMVAYGEEVAMERISLPWLFILDKIIVIRRCAFDSRDDNTYTADFGLVLWRRMGMKLRIATEDVLRSKVALNQAEALGNLPHCEWLRCPLHEGWDALPGREMMLCAGCRSVRIQDLVPWYIDHSNTSRLGAILQSQMPERVRESCTPWYLCSPLPQGLA